LVVVDGEGGLGWLGWVKMRRVVLVGVGVEGLKVEGWVWPKIGRVALVGVEVLVVDWGWPKIGRVALVGWLAGWLVGCWRELVEGAAAGLWFAASG
jgi:hypothetical protein